MNWPASRMGWLFVLLAGALPSQIVSAQSAAEFEVNTPAIMLLQKSMANRFLLLRRHFETGVIGLTHDGSIARRDGASIDVGGVGALDALINEENKDRATLYREIARANGRPEWETDFRAAFAQRWIYRMPPGWFHRNGAGKWIKKEP